MRYFLTLLFFVTVYPNNESFYNYLYAKKINGTREVKKYYTIDGKRKFVIVDIETDKQVIECGLDKRSSLDSIQQALFFSVLTGKAPVVVIYNTDGKIGAYEYRIKEACKKAGIKFKLISIKDNK